MAQATIHDPVQFFVGVLIADMELWDRVRGAIEANWGRIETESNRIDFDQFTDYYEPEMGKNLVRFWVSIEGIRPQEDLIRIKWSCTAIENVFSRDGKRLVNLDPGYLTEAKLILASFKDFAHRIYLTQGVFADMQMIWYHGKFVPREWTFADYRSETAQKFFTNLRAIYRQKLKLYIAGKLKPFSSGFEFGL